MKQLIIFDLDGTLAESKQPLDRTMADWLGRLLAVCQVAIISGGAWPQFEKQLLANLTPAMPDPELLKRLALLPTSGTRYLTYDGQWTERYAEDFTPQESARIKDALDKVFTDAGYASEQHWGEIIEDRGSQITLSALGQEAPLDAKKGWDPDFAKRKAMKAKLAPLLPEFSIGMGGATSLDVTRPGVDKAYGIAKLNEVLGIPIEDMLFVGDALFEGGNDYPARRSGADCIQVAGPSETAKVIETVIACVGVSA